MHIKLTTPPNFEEIKNKFPVTEKDHIFYTYGNCVYCPSGAQMTPDLIAHESVHGEQQSHSEEVAALWWQRYLIDPEWRIEQEAEAYGAQYLFLCQTHKDRNWRARALWELAKHLSSPAYGSAISHSDAMKLIKEYAEDGRVIPNSIN